MHEGGGWALYVSHSIEPGLADFFRKRPRSKYFGFPGQTDSISTTEFCQFKAKAA